MTHFPDTKRTSPEWLSSDCGNDGKSGGAWAPFIMQQAVWGGEEGREESSGRIRSTCTECYCDKTVQCMDGLGIGRLVLWTVTKENRYEAGWFKQPQGCQENPFTDARPKVVFSFLLTQQCGVCEACRSPDSVDHGRIRGLCVQ